MRQLYKKHNLYVQQRPPRTDVVNSNYFCGEKHERSAVCVRRGLVQHIVPNENLLVWNLKEGWEPLCKFLNKPIPKGKFQWEKYSVWFEVQIFEIFEVPVPHDNKTGDAEFMKNYIFKNKFWKKVNANPSVSPSPGSFLAMQFVLISKCSGRAIIHDKYWYWCD